MAASPAPLPAVRPLAGVAWMLASGLSFVAVTGIVRHLGTDLPAAQSAFIRYAIGLLFVAPLLIRVGRDAVRPGTLGLHLGRSVVHTGGVVLWFYAMARIPVAEVTAIGYLNPILATIGAVLLMGERIALRRGLAIAVAMVGALIVLRPGLRELGSGHLGQLGAAVCFAASYLIMKRLSEGTPASVIVATLSLGVAVVLAPFAFWVWVPVGAVQVAWLALVAAFATAGHYTMTRAFAVAPLTVTQPVTFLQLVWATLLGALVFGEGVDAAVLLGGAVIIGAISYMTWREAQLRRRPLTPAPAETKG